MFGPWHYIIVFNTRRFNQNPLIWFALGLNPDSAAKSFLTMININGHKPFVHFSDFIFGNTPIRKFYKLGEKPSVMPINMDDIWLFQENKFPFGISSACFKILILLAP